MRRQRSSGHPASGQPRPPRRTPEASPGRARGKLTGCPSCSASYREGRWTWTAAPVGSHEQVCPACERIAARYPAGVLHVGGGFATSHRDDLIGLIRNVEERERSQHPLKRVMAIEDEDGGFLVETTDAKLVQTLGRALRKAYAGRLEHPPTSSDRENLVRIRWTRD